MKADTKTDTSRQTQSTYFFFPASDPANQKKPVRPSLSKACLYRL